MGNPGLKEILTEQQMSDALRSSNPLELGKYIGADYFVTGRMTNYSDSRASFIFTGTYKETGESFELPSIAMDLNLDSMRQAFDTVANEFGSKFPRIAGKIMEVRGHTATINWPRATGIRIGQRVLVVVQEEPWIDEDTGEVLAEGETTIVATLKVTATLQDFCEAEFIADEYGEYPKIEKGMTVLSK